MSRSLPLGAVAGSLAAAVLTSGAFTQEPASSPAPPGAVASAGSGMTTGSGPAATAEPSPAAGVARGRWIWPVRGKPQVLRPFRAPTSDYGPGHRGLDLAAAEGAAVVAVESGLVTHAAVLAGRGTVTVEHADGLRSTYEPVAATVAVGSTVVAGQMIGTVRVRDGPTHCGARTCLHLGAVRGGSYLDPYPLLSGGRLALLPIG